MSEDDSVSERFPEFRIGQVGLGDRPLTDGQYGVINGRPNSAMPSHMVEDRTVAGGA